MPAESTLAMPAPEMRKAPKNPRRPTGACSTTIVAAPPISPPTNRPCSMRMRISRIGAAAPIAASDGIRPIAAVDRPIPITVTSSVTLRPSRSPIAPNTSPPSGRNRKPTAKLAKEDSCATNSESPEKKTCGNTVAAARP